MGSFQSTHAREQESRPVEGEEEGEESVGEEEEVSSSLGVRKVLTLVNFVVFG